MLREEATVLTGMLIGLSAIDFRCKHVKLWLTKRSHMSPEVNKTYFCSKNLKQLFSKYQMFLNVNSN